MYPMDYIYLFMQIKVKDFVSCKYFFPKGSHEPYSFIHFYTTTLTQMEIILVSGNTINIVFYIRFISDIRFYCIAFVMFWSHSFIYYQANCECILCEYHVRAHVAALVMFSPLREASSFKLVKFIVLWPALCYGLLMYLNLQAQKSEFTVWHSCQTFKYKKKKTIITAWLKWWEQQDSHLSLLYVEIPLKAFI